MDENKQKEIVEKANTTGNSIIKGIQEFLKVFPKILLWISKAMDFLKKKD